VTDVADPVAAVPELGVIPSVIAGGATVRVAAAEDRVAALEVVGSPAVLPLAARIDQSSLGCCAASRFLLAADRALRDPR
jgi:hypothetical protein